MKTMQSTSTSTLTGVISGWVAVGFSRTANMVQ